jgi:D-sedoheptulose 7-phosphate isomerase
MDDLRPRLQRNCEASVAVTQSLPDLAPALTAAAALLADALEQGRTVLTCGNGGSAAQSAHFSAEIAGRYIIERRGFPAVDLSSNHSLLTAMINDYDPATVFARQVQALGKPGDVLVAFTTSGNSANIVAALEMAKTHGLKTIALLGKGGGRCRGLADVELIVASGVTARIQEAHTLLYHTLCDALDPLLAQWAGSL